MGMGSLFDFSTQSTSYSLQSTITNTDSNNRTQNESQVLDQVGNVTVNLAQDGGVDRYLPFVALGLLALALFKD